MKSDVDIKHDVLAALRFEPGIDEAGVGVLVKHGIVTLAGTLNSLSEKTAAEQAVKGVSGVRGLAIDLQVRYAQPFEHSDSEIAMAIANALDWNASVPKDKIEVKVEAGRVFLSGRVEWGYQKYAVINTVKNISGVRELYAQELVLEPKIRVVDARHKIERALERMADIDATQVDVDVHGDTVFLKGIVRSTLEKEEAEHAAMRAPGVRRVINELKVRYSGVPIL